MTNKELVDRFAEENGIPKYQAKALCKSLFTIIEGALSDGDSVLVSSFGVFETRVRDARVGFNPTTHEPLNIPARRYPAFRASISLREAVSEV